MIPLDVVKVGMRRSVRVVRRTRGRRRVVDLEIMGGRAVRNDEFDFVALVCFPSDDEQIVDCLRILRFLL